MRDSEPLRQSMERDVALQAGMQLRTGLTNPATELEIFMSQGKPGVRRQQDVSTVRLVSETDLRGG